MISKWILILTITIVCLAQIIVCPAVPEKKTTQSKIDAAKAAPSKTSAMKSAPPKSDVTKPTKPKVLVPKPTSPPTIPDTNLKPVSKPKRAEKEEEEDENDYGDAPQQKSSQDISMEEELESKPVSRYRQLKKKVFRTVVSLFFRGYSYYKSFFNKIGSLWSGKK